MGKRYWTEETFLAYWTSTKENNSFTLLDYSNITTRESKFIAQCNECLRIHSPRIGNFTQRGINCLHEEKTSQNKITKKSKFDNSFVAELFSTSEYTNVNWDNPNEIINSSRNIIKYTCKICMKQKASILNDLIKIGPVCRRCGKHLKWVEDTIAYQFTLLEDIDLYELDMESIRGITTHRQKFRVKHLICNQFFSVNSHHFFNDGSRCPFCQRSKGEERIHAFLLKEDIEFIEQFTFNECTKLRPLPFDFYLTKYNLLIEYQGTQHYNDRFFGGAEEFARRQEYDKFKKECAISAGFNFLEIPYWDFNKIEEILVAALLLLN